MVQQSSGGIKIFIGIQKTNKTVNVSVKLLNDSENIHPNWYIENVKEKSRKFSRNNDFVILKYSKKDYDRYNLSYTSKIYDYYTDDLFYYLQRNNSAFGPVENVTETSDGSLILSIGITVFIVGIMSGLYMYTKEDGKKIKKSN